MMYVGHFHPIGVDMSLSTAIGIVLLLAFVFYKVILEKLVFSPLAKIPGPKLWALTPVRLAFEDWRGKRTPTINKLHEKYGPTVRVGPREVSIYGAGSAFEKPTFYYGIFDVWGSANLFSMKGVKPHAERRKLLSHPYSKGRIMKGDTAAMIERNARDYLRQIEVESNRGNSIETFTTLHYYSIDTISNFIFGPEFGGTSCLVGNPEHRALLDDIFDPARRKLIWWFMHFPNFTSWLYTRSGIQEELLRPFLPMQKPATYSGVRAHCLRSWKKFDTASNEEKSASHTSDTILGLLWKNHQTYKGSGGLTDMDIASECADEFLAGVDTTSDSTMFLIWALSQPKNRVYQERLTQEVSSLSAESINAYGIPTVEATDKLPFLDAVIKETLRMYAPLPASEPRSSRTDTVIDEYQIPANTIVGVGPYYLHRRADIFPDPQKFDPDRWLNGTDSGKVSEEEFAGRKRNYWPFSSGSRMCIGMHLALAEMKVLVAAIYREYRTSIPDHFAGITPGITSRFELHYDETYQKIVEHACYIDFKRRDN
ncbi:hypothetical protein CLAIMM_04682 [Cladophialophora immunda]|nr:hypothetical protein CLAIMM_04682 [Cladophialophora immunda]